MQGLALELGTALGAQFIDQQQVDLGQLGGDAGLSGAGVAAEAGLDRGDDVRRRCVQRAGAIAAHDLGEDGAA
ncbi:hypothetical protein D9M69_699180 [compost metagenome]